MTCSLTDQQLENLYRVVYTEMALARKDNRPFDIKTFSSDLYKSILQKSGDANKAATFVQQVPEFVLSAMTVNELWRHLSSTGFDANQVMSLAREFKDEQKGFSNVVDYVGAKVDQKQQEQEVITDQNGKDEVQPGVEDVPEEESAKPSNPWSTTGQEAKYWNPKKNPREFAARNQIDADKSFHNSVVRSVGTAVREAEGDSSKARLGNHVGFKLQVVPATEFPFEHLYKETQLWLTGPEADQEKHNKGVLAVITDNEGNWLYFNDKGEVGTREDGRPVYQFIRVPREKAGELNFMRYHPESGQLIEQLLTPKEMLAKEQREAAKNGTPYTEEFSKQRLEELTQERKDKTAFIKKMRDFVSSDKKNRVLLDITGGTLGVFTQKWSKIGKFVTDEDMRSITLDKSVTGTGGGRYMIRLKNIATPIPIDRPQINADLAFKIASVLTLPIKVEGEYLPNSAKVDYAKQFLQNGNKYSNNFTVSYNPEDGSIFVSIAGAKSTIPTPEQLERSGLSTENLRKHIVDSLMNVFWREQVKGQPEYKPSRLSINDDLVSRGEYVDYNLQTDNGKITSATAESKNYYDFLRENAQIGVAGTNDMDVTMLNAYLHFAPTQEVIDQVEGKTKEEPKAKTEVKTPDPHEDDINSDLISGLLKSRGLDNSATQDQIRSAKNWYESSPLAKHIPFKAMFNVVNSDAFARWTVDGITLYQGANYTDLYHEAWHGFSQLFLTKEQKKQLYNEARNLPGLKDKSDFEVEEHLAEDFRKYAMSGAKTQGGKARNSIFRRIWNFLKEFFFGISPRDAQTQPDSVDKIREVYNKLFFGQLNEYLPSINNVQFGVLNKGVEPLEKTSEENGEEVVNQPLSLEESRLVVDSIDSLISEAINQLNKYRGDNTATTQILTEKSKLSKLYENIKENFTKRRDKYAEEAERETDPFTKRKLEDNIRLLNYIIKNFGDPSKVLSGSESKGVVFYHQQKTKFLGVSQRIYDVTDEASSDEDIINKGMRRNDRSGNELSLKELANDETLYLIRSLHRIEDGKIVKNRLGIPELVDFDKTWNKIVRTLEGSISPEEMYSKLQATQGIFPEFTQLLQKLADPARTSMTRSEFDMNTKFWQDFNKPRVPLIQMILDKSVREDNDGNVTETYDMRVGQASADYFKVIATWKNKFRTDSPSNNKYILQDAQRHNYLNTPAVMREFADPRGQLKEGKEYEFLRAIGMYFDESNPVMEDMLKAAKGTYGVGYIFNAIKTVNNALQAHPKPTSEQQAAQTAAHAFILDPIEGLRKAQPDLKFDTNASRIKALAELHAKFSDEYSDFSVVNAENNRQYEHTLNNTLTVIVNSINKAKTYQELVDPLVDTENNFRHMRWLNIDRNPIAASSVWLNSVFDLDRFKPDGSPNQNFGKKRMASTEEGSGPVKINLENLSGVQIVINGLYPETGIATSRSDRFTKFLSDFHMMLLNGRVELMRHASKSSAYDIIVSSLRTDPSKKDANLYVDTTKFISPKGSDSYDGFGYAFKIIQGYIGAELRRIKMVNDNLEYYRTIAGYNREVGGGKIAGQVFTAFDDVLSDSLKQQLYNLKGDFQQAMMEDEGLRNQVKTQVKQYFDNQVARNNAILNETGEKYIHQRVYEKIRSGIKGLSNEQVEQAAVRSFTYNSWIHNFESTALIYGDLCQYNHAKEEFHKRNAGTGSTGYMFRTDKAAQQHITDVVGRKYAESIGAPSRGYNGTFNTAILADSVVNSVYEKEYRDFFTKYYNELYSSRKDMGQAQKSKVIAEKVEAAMEPYSNMKEGDGQGWVSFDSYRIMRILEGKWTENQERLYHEIIAGKHKGNAEVLQFFPAYKVQQYGPLETSGLPVMAFHKFSLFPMIPSVIQGTNMEVVHNMMTNQGIDYALFESGSKLGSLTAGGKPDKIYKDNEQRVINEGLQFTKNTIFANYLKDQLDIHNEYKGKVIFSTQLRKLIEEGLFENGVPVDFLEGSGAEKRISQWASMDEQAREKVSPLYRLAKRYENHIDELSRLKKQELLEEAGWTEDKFGNPVGDLKNLLDVVRNNLSRQDIADHQLDFLDTDEMGNLKWDLSMHLSADKLERLLTAMVNNRLVRQKVKGESLVQVSTSLFEKAAQQAGSKFTNPTEADLKKYGTNDLPTYHKIDPKDPNSKTAAMKVKIALQGDSRNLLNLTHNDGSPIATWERLNEMLKSEEWLDKGANRKAITMVGVRIPVQGLNSMEFMEVYEFLPPEAGNIIVPPSEIVAKSGADFDIDKLTVFMTALGENGEFLTREGYTKGTDQIDAELEKIRAQYAPIKEKAMAALEEARSTRDLSKEFLSKEVPRIEEAIRAVREERSHLLELIRGVIEQLQNTSRMPANLVEASKQSDQDLLKALFALSKNNRLAQIDARISKYYSDIRTLKSEKMEQLYQEKSEQFESLKDYQEMLKEARKSADEKLNPFKKQMRELRELKKRYASTVENEIIEDIKSILEHPSNYISLIRPNGTDIVRPVADGKDGLAEHVQDYNPRENFTSAPPKKGVSPTRVLEVGYNLYKHESNNIGKRTLGIGAVENTYSTIFNRIGAYMNTSYVYPWGKVPQERRIKLLLPHNSFEDGKEVKISLSNLYDASGENRIADVISQLMNGWVDIEKDAWVFFVQGNNEITPTLLFLIKSGVPFRQAAWFVSQPLVREYVREQRLARSTFAGPMHKAPEEPNYYRVKAKSEVLKHIFGKTFKSQELYTKTVEMTNKALGANGEFTPEMIEKIVKTKDTQSDLAKAAFLHFLEIEEMMKGIANLKFKTNVDTRRSTTLFDAQNRLAEIEMLRDESRLPTELIDKVLEESVIGSFFVQDFQLKLWSKLFSLRNNDTLTQFLNGVIKDRDMRSEVEKNFGDDMERFVSEFKNDLLLFIFQNSLRDFNLGIDKTYKGMAVSEAPIKYVDKLEFGAFVKKDESGQPKIFVDPLQLKSDWISKAFTAGSSSANSYKERELATLPTKAFMWRGVDSEKEYYKFVVEREYLRYLIPFSDFQRTMEYKENYRRNQSILQQSKTIQESQEAFAARVARATYEQMLRNKALENTFNPWKMFQSDTSVPLQFLQIVQQYPQLEKEYSFISQLAVVSDPKLDMSNLTLKDRDLSADKVNRYYENLRKLSDPSVEKVPDREENMRISMFFAKLPMFAFMQSGLSKNANSFTAVVSYEPFVKMMEKPVKDFVNNVLNGPDAEVVLQRFMDQFIEQNGRRNRKMRSKFKNYLLDKTPRAMRSDYDPEAESTRPDVTRDLRPLNKEGTYGYTDMKIGALDKKTNTYNMTPKKTADYSAMLKGNPHVVFVFSDNVYSRENPNLKTGGSVDMRSMGNSMGILTALKRGESMKNLTPEQITQMKNKIEADIMELVSLRDDGKDIAFSEAGYGSPDTMPDELFLYLSERLYEEFGFINPGSSSLPSVKEIIGREQGISQQEIDDFMRQCFGQ